jgi:hypothetical protein
VALTSEVTHLKDHNLKLANNTKPVKSKNSGGKPKQSGGGKKPSKKSTDEDKWAWKKVPPKEGEPQSKQMPDFDKIHHWCEDHQAWVVHTPASCTVRISREEAEADQALAAVLEGFESDELDIASLSSVVVACYLGVIWLKLMFIATHFINLECALSYMIGSEIFDVYLAMTCSMVLLILLFEGIKNLSVYFKTEETEVCLQIPVENEAGLTTL